MVVHRLTRVRAMTSIVAVGALLALPMPALGAPSKDQCVDANTQAQNLKRDDKLLSARAALRSCVDLACPKLVQADCTLRLNELEQSIPSITFVVKDGAGSDLSAVAVTIDDRPLVDHLDGTPIELDPGAHVFKFTTADLPPVTRSLVIQQGERGRREGITLAAPPPQSAPTLPAPAAAAAPIPMPPPVRSAAVGAPDKSQTPPAAGSDSRGSGPGAARKAVAWTAVGIGAAGLIVGAVGGALALSKKHSLDNDPTCRQNACPPGEANVSSYDNLRTVSSVGFIAGGLFTATGVVLLLTGPSPSRSSAALWFGPGSAGLTGRF